LLLIINLKPSAPLQASGRHLKFRLHAGARWGHENEEIIIDYHRMVSIISNVHSSCNTHQENDISLENLLK
jgi:hypothetical protein